MYSCALAEIYLINATVSVYSGDDGGIATSSNYDAGVQGACIKTTNKNWILYLLRSWYHGTYTHTSSSTLTPLLSNIAICHSIRN